MAERDVAVIGAGVIGLSIAWKLAQRGCAVTLIDPAPARGASYVAAGMLAPITEAAYGEEALIEVNVRSARRWAAFAEELEAESGQVVALRTTGTLLIATDASDRAQLEELGAFQRDLGLNSTWISTEQARMLEALVAPNVRGALFAEEDFQVDNRRLLSSLNEALEQHHVERRLEPVTRIEVQGDRVLGVVAGGEHLGFSHVVVAAGYRSSSLPGLTEGLIAPIRPVKGQILRLFAPDPSLRLERTVRAVVQGRAIYIVPRQDGRTVIGATMEEAGVDTTVSAVACYEMLRDAIRVVPAIGEYEFVEASAGLRPGSPDNRPLIGPTGVHGLSVAAGHHRNGILLAPVTAEAIAALICDGAVPAWAQPFDPSRFRRRTSRDIQGGVRAMRITR